MPKKQHLFAITRWLLKAGMALSIGVLVLLAVALGGLLVVGTTFSSDSLGMPLSLSAADRFHVIVVAAFAIGYGMTCTALVFFGLRATAGILETAISGDPFVSENATRLVRIGWLLLAGETIGFPALVTFKLLIARIPPNLVKQANLHFCDFNVTTGGVADKVCTTHGTNGVSLIGLVAVLLVFVLAQIFRRGSEMRAELEATV